MSEYTKTERAILDVLSDGQPHIPADLLAVLDEQADMSYLHKHLSRMRKKLPGRQVIICQTLHRKGWFRLMRTLR